MVVIVDSFPTIPQASDQRAPSLLRRARRFAKLDLNLQTVALRKKLFPGRAMSKVELIKETCRRAADQYRPRSYHGRVVFFRPRDLTALGVEQDPNAWRKLVVGEFTEHVVDLHDRGRVTGESVQSGYNEIANKLSEMLVQGPERSEGA
jgi:hypothetical protein